MESNIFITKQCGRKKGWLYWFVLLTVIQILFSSVHCENDVVDPSQVTAGLNVGSAIADFLQHKKLPEVLTKVAKNIGKFLGAIGPFVDLFLAFASNVESGELQFMKEMMKKIDRRFNMVDQKLNDIQRLVEWASYKQKFMELETNIRTMATQFTELYSMPTEAAKNGKTLFQNNFENSYGSAGAKLYQAVVQSGAVFSEDLPTAVAKFTEYDLQRCQEIYKGVLSLLIRASVVELGYLASKNFKKVREFSACKWEQRFIDIIKRFEATERFIKSNYLAQSGKDLDKLIANKISLGADGFTSAVYDFMTKKYFWRDWFVVKVYFTAYYEFDYKAFGGHFREKDGKIVVASVPKTNPPTIITEAKTWKYDNKWVKIFKSVPRSNEFFGFVTSNKYSKFSIKAPANRYYKTNNVQYSFNSVILFA